MKAYSLYLKKSAKRLPLLIADLKEDTIDRILHQEQIEEIKPMLRYPGYIPHTDLPAIYNRASVFLYTSLRESFGIPLLEAMACGTPVITSNTSAIPEIAGKDALLINPEKAETIAKVLIELEQNPLLRRKQIEYGLERVKHFSWQQTAHQLLNVYQDVIQKH